MALGALVMPFLIDWMGLRLALAGRRRRRVVLIALAALPAMRRLDGRLLRPASLTLLRSVDIFAPLAPATLEALARGASRGSSPAATSLVREGEDSDLFFVIESRTGRGHHTGTGCFVSEGPGEYFGEIGLLRDVAADGDDHRRRGHRRAGARPRRLPDRGHRARGGRLAAERPSRTRRLAV